MCLDTVNVSLKDLPGGAVGEGFKVFRLPFNEIDQKYYVLNFNTEKIKFNRQIWYQADLSGNAQASFVAYTVPYTLGFHLFCNPQDCWNYLKYTGNVFPGHSHVVLPVKFKEILTVGTQNVFNVDGRRDTALVIVSRHLMIPSLTTRIMEDAAHAS